MNDNLERRLDGSPEETPVYSSIMGTGLAAGMAALQYVTMRDIPAEPQLYQTFLQYGACAMTGLMAFMGVGIASMGIRGFFKRTKKPEPETPQQYAEPNGYDKLSSVPCLAFFGFTGAAAIEFGTFYLQAQPDFKHEECGLGCLGIAATSFLATYVLHRLANETPRKSIVPLDKAWARNDAQKTH